MKITRNEQIPLEEIQEILRNFWISIKDRECNLGERVLAIGDELKSPLMGHYIGKEQLQFNPALNDISYEYKTLITKITHWMPLPAHPRG